VEVPCRSKYAPFEYTLSIIGGKWKMKILYQLASNEILRFNKLKRVITGVSYKMLSAQLKELESDGIIIRKEYPQVPPKVEYSLSEKGKTLIPVLNEMCRWGVAHSNQQDVNI
jgi:DNA-binding HxlR family transcriptional regulator